MRITVQVNNLHLKLRLLANHCLEEGRVAPAHNAAHGARPVKVKAGLTVVPVELERIDRITIGSGKAQIVTAQFGAETLQEANDGLARTAPRLMAIDYRQAALCHEVIPLFLIGQDLL